MENNNLKKMWKSKIDSNIKSYSDKELSTIIVKSAQKSIKKTQPRGILRIIVICIVVYLIVKLIVGNNSLEIKVIDSCALLILSISYFLWERSAYIMNKYRFDMPVKEWLEYRIREVEKSIRIKKKYGLFIYGGAVILGSSFGIIPLFFRETFDFLTAIALLSFTIIFVVIISQSMNKNYNKTLSELKELYKQFEE